MMSFLIYLGICSIFSLLSAIGYVHLLKKINIPNGSKKDFIKLTLYIAFLGIIIFLTYIVDLYFPNGTRKELRIFEAFPFLFGYGYFLFNYKKLKKLSE